MFDKTQNIICVDCTYITIVWFGIFHFVRNTITDHRYLSMIHNKNESLTTEIYREVTRDRATFSFESKNTPGVKLSKFNYVYVRPDVLKRGVVLI